MCYDLSALAARISRTFKRTKLCVPIVPKTPIPDNTFMNRFFRYMTNVSCKKMDIKIVCQSVFITDKRYNVYLLFAAALLNILWFYWVLPIWKYCKFLKEPLAIDTLQLNNTANIKTKPAVKKEPVKKREANIGIDNINKTGSVSNIVRSSYDKENKSRGKSKQVLPDIYQRRIVVDKHLVACSCSSCQSELENRLSPQQLRDKVHIIRYGEPVKRSERIKKDVLTNHGIQETSENNDD